MARFVVARLLTSVALFLTVTLNGDDRTKTHNRSTLLVRDHDLRFLDDTLEVLDALFDSGLHITSFLVFGVL